MNPQPVVDRHPEARRGRAWLITAAAWSVVYLIITVAWRLGAPGYPYGLHWDPSGRAISLVDDLPWSTGSAVLVIAAALGSITAGWLLARPRGGPVARTLTGGILALAVGIVVAGDYRPLMAIGRTPVYLITKITANIPADVGPATFFAEMYKVPVLHQLWLLAGLGIWLFALRGYWEHATGGCAACGRPERLPAWTTHDGARRWGLVATAIAVVCPLPYIASRYLLAAGIPAGGFSREQLVQLDAEAPGIWVFGAGLATFGLVGALLTLGLAMRWGERWPGWVPFLRGRTIPPKAAIIPATTVSLLLPGAALMLIRIDFQRYAAEGGGTLVQLLLAIPWGLWGFALGAATLAYSLRRRADCDRCHRDEAPAEGSAQAVRSSRGEWPGRRPGSGWRPRAGRRSR